MDSVREDVSRFYRDLVCLLNLHKNMEIFQLSVSFEDIDYTS